MAEIFPFSGYRYNSGQVRLAQVLTQPYDKITPAMQEKYFAADSHNLVAVEKGRSLPSDTPQNNVYTRAARALDDWIAKKVLVRESAPSVYVSEQQYEVPGTTERRVRRGVIALGRIEDYSAGVVFRHEQTLAGPKADRLELLRHTRAHTGQLFMLYSDPERAIDIIAEEISHANPAMDVRDEYGVTHRLWVVSDAALITRIQVLLSDKKLTIADGHHRYETALAYRDECRARLGTADRDAPHEKVMMTLVNTHSPGLTILPTHRVVANLKDFKLKAFFEKLQPHFNIGFHPFENARERLQAHERLQAYDAFRSHFETEWQKKGERLIGVYAGSDRSWSGEQAFFVLTLKPDANLEALLPQVSPAQRALDIVLLHRFILEEGLGISSEDVVREKNITYEREMDAAIATVDRGVAQVCFLLNPVGVEQVMSMATSGEVLPQKSTDFYPKLLSGVTIYKL